MTVIARSSELINQAIFYAIYNNLIEHSFQIQEVTDEYIIENIQSGKVDFGIVSPLQFAKNPGNLRVVGDFAVYSYHFAYSSLLFFTGNLKNIDTIYYRDRLAYDFDKFIAQLALREVFEVDAEWKGVKDMPFIGEALKNLPVVFLAGENAFDNSNLMQNYIDLSEEWVLKTELPLPHRILVTHEDFQDNGEIEALKLSRELGIRNLKKIAKSHSEHRPQNWDLYFDLISESYQYFPSEDVWDSLKELFQYMFFYNVTDYIPELKFL